MASRRSTDPSRTPPSPPRATIAAQEQRSPRRARRVSEMARRELIAVGAYLRAERRGFVHGHAEEDWLAAEAEVDALLRVSPRGPSQ